MKNFFADKRNLMHELYETFTRLQEAVSTAAKTALSVEDLGDVITTAGAICAIIDDITLYARTGGAGDDFDLCGYYPAGEAYEAERQEITLVENLLETEDVPELIPIYFVNEWMNAYFTPTSEPDEDLRAWADRNDYEYDEFTSTMRNKEA